MVYAVMKYEINNPRIVICPADTQRTWAEDFGTIDGRII